MRSIFSRQALSRSSLCARTPAGARSSVGSFSRSRLRRGGCAPAPGPGFEAVEAGFEAVEDRKDRVRQRVVNAWGKLGLPAYNAAPKCAIDGLQNPSQGITPNANCPSTNLAPP